MECGYKQSDVLKSGFISCEMVAKEILTFEIF